MIVRVFKIGSFQKRLVVLKGFKGTGLKVERLQPIDIEHNIDQGPGSPTNIVGKRLYRQIKAESI